MAEQGTGDEGRDEGGDKLDADEGAEGAGADPAAHAGRPA